MSIKSTTVLGGSTFVKTLIQDVTKRFFRFDVPQLQSESKELCKVKVCCPDVPHPDAVPPELLPLKNKYDARVVIVGAGVAGLSAAQTLVCAGLTDVTLLEAGTRAGGRIRSHWMKDTVVELGANVWRSDVWTNPILVQALEDGTAQVPVSGRDPSKGLFHESDGRPYPLYVGLKAYRKAVNIIGEVNKQLRKRVPRESVIEYVGVRLQQELRQFPDDMTHAAARVMVGVLTGGRGPYSRGSTRVNNDDYGAYIEVPTTDVQIPLGYMGALAPMLKTVTAEKILYNKRVERVRWGAVHDRDGPRAFVRCCDGSEYPAHFVLVTLPLGVLKKHAEDMFCPALPCYKMEAIQELDFKHYDKIYIEYDLPLWVWRDKPIRIGVTKRAASGCWTKGITAVDEVPGSEYVLRARVEGCDAKEMEKTGEHRVLEDVTEFLRSHLGDPGVPEPVALHRTAWSGDVHFRGAQSAHNSAYLTPQITQKIKDLFSPLPTVGCPVTPIIMFAGEATHAALFATVEGAKISGIREAERILKIINESPDVKHEKSICVVPQVTC